MKRVWIIIIAALLMITAGCVKTAETQELSPPEEISTEVSVEDEDMPYRIGAVGDNESSDWRRRMRISYNKLWDLMKKNKMRKTDLAKAAEITGYTMTKMNKNEPVTLEVMMRVCKVFHCDIGDVMEMIEE